MSDRSDPTRRSNVAKLAWFLKRPAHYSEFARRVKRRLSRRNRRSVVARSWCAERSVNTRAAIELLTDGTDFESLSERAPEELRRARERVDRAPIEMGGAANLDLLYNLAEHLEARRVIETGVAYGWSALALLLSLQGRPDSLLISTDFPYAVPGSDAQVGVAVSPELRSRWRLITRPDRSALPEALTILPTIDMCHYDSVKAYEDRMWAYPMLWQALRPGGFFVSDDIGDNEAFRDFSAAVGQSPIVVAKDSPEGNRYVGVLVKAD